MRQPTFFARAWPRFDHQVYWSGRGSTSRNASTHLSSPKRRSSQARSSGRNPEFFRFDFQFFRSISLVRDVDVAAEHVVAVAPAELLQVRQEHVEEAVLRGLALGSGRARGQVQRHDRQASELELEIAALVVEFGHAETRDDAVGLFPRVDRDAAVAGPLRIEVAAVVAGRPEAFVAELMFLRLRLLQADDVRALRGQPLEQALAGRGADTVAVECEDAHAGAAAVGP